MPKVELIPVEQIPHNRSWQSGRAQIPALADRLREALHGNKALILRQAEDERPARFSTLLRKAADSIGVVIVVTSGGRRTYVNASGRSVKENSVLYAQITKAAPTQQPASGARTSDILAHRPLIVPPARYEPTVLPGVEVSR